MKGDISATTLSRSYRMRPIALLLLRSVLACNSRTPSDAPVEGNSSYTVAGALPTGRTLDPERTSRVINPITLTMLRAPQHRFVLVQSGWGAQGIQIVDTLGVPTQTIEEKAAFVGAAFSPDSAPLNVSGGDRDMIYVYRWRSGAAARIDSLVLQRHDSATAHGSRYPAGVGVSPNGRFLYVAENLGDPLAVIDLADKRVVQRLATGAYPYRMVVTRNGRVIVSVWSASHVLAFTPMTMGLSATPA